MVWVSVSLLVQLVWGLVLIGGTQSGYAPKKYRVISIVSPPYVVASNTSGHYTGYIIDILNLLKAGGDFDYTISISQDGVYGDFFANGTATGLIHSIQSGEYDIAAADLTVTRNRSKAVDFTRQFDQVATRVAINRNFDNRTAKAYVISGTTGPLLNYLTKTKHAPIVPIWKNIQARIPESLLDTPEQIAAAIQRLVNGENIIVVGEAPGLIKAIGNNTNKVFFAPGTFYQNSYAFAVKLGSSLRRFLYLKLSDLAENGQRDALYGKYFGNLCSGAVRVDASANITGTSAENQNTNQ